jgi:hypothetical protein
VKPGSQPENLEENLLALDRKYVESHKLEVLEGVIKFTEFAKQGDKLYHRIVDESEESSCSSLPVGACSVKNSRSGTLGGFMKETHNQHKLYGLSCRHVLDQRNGKVYVKFGTNENLTELGHTSYLAEEPFHDFAMFEVKEDLYHKCEGVFVNDDDDESNAVVHEENLAVGTIVHKKGATTAWTAGRIQSPEFYSNLFEGRDDVFLVTHFGDGDYFAKAGDSGSIVFSRDTSSDQSSVSVLGMVIGGIDEIRESQAPHSSEIETSTLCFRLNTALDKLREAEKLSLEFLPKDSSTFSDSNEKEDE